MEEFQVSALERLESALRQVEVRALGEVATSEPETAAAPGPETAATPRATEAAPETRSRRAPTRSAVWDEGPAAAASPASPPSPAPPRPVVEGNRTAFETWVRRLGGK